MRVFTQITLVTFKVTGFRKQLSITSLLASSIPSSSAFSYPHNKIVFSNLRCCEPNPWSKPFDQNFIKFNQSFQSDASTNSNRDFNDLKSNRKYSFKRNQTHSGFLPSLPPIYSIESELNNPVDSPFTTTHPSLRLNSSLDSPCYRVSLYSTQSYFNENLDKYLYEPSPLLKSPVNVKQELSSDVSWESKSSGRGRSYSRDYLTLDLKDSESFRSSTTELYQKVLRRRKTVDSEESVCTIVEGVKSAMFLSPRQAFKHELEGKVVSPKCNKSSDSEAKKASNQKSKQDLFRKCSTRSSVTSNEEATSPDMVDDVFDKPDLKAKSKLPKASSKKSIPQKAKSNKRSNNDEANKPAEIKSRNSSVTIKDIPECFAGKTSTKSSKIASSNAIAKLNSKPSRASLKKSTNNNNSDYDRDRGRSRHMEGGHRESFKKNDRTNERGSDQDRDSSDRELKDGSFNRSLSNTDTNLEDRIGKKF